MPRRPSRNGPAELLEGRGGRAEAGGVPPRALAKAAGGGQTSTASFGVCRRHHGAPLPSSPAPAGYEPAARPCFSRRPPGGTRLFLRPLRCPGEITRPPAGTTCGTAGSPAPPPPPSRGRGGASGDHAPLGAAAAWRPAWERAAGVPRGSVPPGEVPLVVLVKYIGFSHSPAICLSGRLERLVINQNVSSWERKLVGISSVQPGAALTWCGGPPTPSGTRPFDIWNHTWRVLGWTPQTFRFFAGQEWISEELKMGLKREGRWDFCSLFLNRSAVKLDGLFNYFLKIILLGLSAEVDTGEKEGK